GDACCEIFKELDEIWPRYKLFREFRKRLVMGPPAHQFNFFLFQSMEHAYGMHAVKFFKNSTRFGRDTSFSANSGNGWWWGRRRADIFFFCSRAWSMTRGGMK